MNDIDVTQNQSTSDNAAQPSTPISQPSQNPSSAPQSTATTQQNQNVAAHPSQNQAGTANPNSSQPQGFEPHSLWGNIFKALGGGDRTEYHVAAPGELDAQGKPVPEGTTVATKVAPTKGQLGKAIIAAVITGLAAGEQQRGPGAGLRSLAAGGAVTMQARQMQDEKARQQAQSDFAQQQQVKLRQAQIFSANAEAIHNIRMAEQLQEETFQSMIDRDSQSLSEVDPSDIVAKDVPQDQALAELKAGKYGATTHNVYVTGSTEVRDKNGNVVVDPNTGEPRREATVTVTQDKPVMLTKEDTARYAQYGIPGFKGLNPSDGAQVLQSQKRGWDQMVHSIENARGIAKKMGVTDEEFSKASQEPGAAKAFQAYARFATGDPYADLQEMEKAKDKQSGNPIYGVRTMQILRDAFGGEKAMRYHDAIETKRKGAAAAAEAAARAPEQQANRDAAMKVEMVKKGAELGTKADSEFNDVVSKSSNLRQSIQAAQNGDALAAAIAPLEGVLFITTANGVKRINEIELRGLQMAGSAKDRLQAWINGKIKGDTIPSDIKQDYLAMVDQYERNARAKYQRSLDSINKRYGTNLQPAFGPQETQEPQTAPQGNRPPGW